MMKKILRIDNVGRIYIPAEIRDMMPGFRPHSRCELTLNEDGTVLLKGLNITRADKFKEDHPDSAPHLIKPCHLKKRYICPKHRDCAKCREEYWNGSE